MDNACHLPDEFTHTPPKMERSGADIAKNAPTVEKIIADAKNQQAIARFLGNLEKQCGANTEALKGITVSTYRIHSDYKPIDNGLLFIVSDNTTGKVLSYHTEDGKCLLELDKKMTPIHIALTNKALSNIASSDKVNLPAMQYEAREENGVVKYHVIKAIQ